MENLTDEQKKAVESANYLLEKFELVILEVGAPKPPK
jgi:hypothetical protein